MKKKNRPQRKIIFDQLVDDITHGKIKTGEKLRESELANRFNVSRTPVREALYLLEQGDYVSHTMNAGAVVKKDSERKIRDIYNVTAILEGNAVEIVVAQKITKEKIIYLESLNKSMQDSVNEKNYIQYEKLNRQFHDFFLKKTRNELLFTMAKSLHKKMLKLRSESLPLVNHFEHYIESHKKIIYAIYATEPLLAGSLMKHHIKEVAKHMIINPKNDSNHH